MATDQLAKVRKLLERAERADDPVGAAAATALAAKLMAKYGIDRALLAKQAPASNQRIDKVMSFRAPQAKAQGYLYAKTLDAMRCRVVLKDGYKTVHVFGFQADMDLAEMMHKSLTVQVNRGLVTAPLRPANQRGADVRSFIFGFTDVTAGRLRDVYAQSAAAAQEELEPGQHSVALVLADQKTLVDAAVKAAYPVLGTLRTSTSGRARAAGVEAGRRADLGLGSIRNRQSLTRPA